MVEVGEASIGMFHLMLMKAVLRLLGCENRDKDYGVMLNTGNSSLTK